MDDREHHLINTVILIVGPNFDIELKLVEDENEDTPSLDGVVIERLVPQIERSGTKKDNAMCIVVPVEEGDKRFIMDSGSGHDLVSHRKALRVELAMNPCEPITFHTANGITTAEYAVDIEMGTLKEKACVAPSAGDPGDFGLRFVKF